VKEDNGDYRGVEAVVDKDLTSSVLAASIGAELLIILTDVPQLYLNYGQPDQRGLDALTVHEAQRLVAERHFAPGSMGPKVEAIERFLRAGGRRGLITDPATLGAALEGRGGTHFVGRL